MIGVDEEKGRNGPMIGSSSKSSLRTRKRSIFGSMFRGSSGVSCEIKPLSLAMGSVVSMLSNGRGDLGEEAQ